MAFVMSLARTKRVKYIGQDGSEVFQEDNRWHFLSAELLASQVACQTSNHARRISSELMKLKMEFHCRL